MDSVADFEGLIGSDWAERFEVALVIVWYLWEVEELGRCQFVPQSIARQKSLTFDLTVSGEAAISMLVWTGYILKVEVFAGSQRGMTIT